jgi:uncharacterized protein (TIGR03435 family)
MRASFTEIAPVGERFTATNVTLKLLIMAAYGVTERQVLSGPGLAEPNWLNPGHYDIDAKAERPGGHDQIRHDQMLQMLQALFTDLFQLKMHLNWPGSFRFACTAT